MAADFFTLPRTVLFALLMGLATAASAQATRTWVSGVGDDANPCSRTAPCKTFAGAISKTAAKGEINIIDAGAYGAVTITKSISIIATGAQAGVLATLGSSGIIVNLPLTTDRVVLEGLDIEGAGTGNHGVSIVGTGSVVLRRSTIRGFAGDGVHLTGTAGARVFVQDSNISFIGGVGVLVQGSGGASNNGIIDRTTIDTTTGNHVKISGPGSIYISGSQLIGGSADKLSATTGTIYSYGNNVMRDPLGTTPTLMTLR